MSERIRGSYDDALYTNRRILYFTLLYFTGWSRLPITSKYASSMCMQAYASDGLLSLFIVTHHSAVCSQLAVAAASARRTGLLSIRYTQK